MSQGLRVLLATSTSNVSSIQPPLVAMPSVTLTVRASKSPEFKAELLDAIQSALVDIGAHPDDPPRTA